MTTCEYCDYKEYLSNAEFTVCTQGDWPAVRIDYEVDVGDGYKDVGYMPACKQFKPTGKECKWTYYGDKIYSVGCSAKSQIGPVVSGMLCHCCGNKIHIVVPEPLERING